MKQLISDLIKVLSNKNFGESERNLIIECFALLAGRFENKPHKLIDFIENINNLKNFTIVKDINKDYFMSSKIKMLNSKELKIKEKIFEYEYYNNNNLFRIEDDKYIPDKNGEYYLYLEGYMSYEKKFIVIFNYNIETFLHEYEHLTQKGFKVSSKYFASAELAFMLLEGDAMDFSLNVLKHDKKIMRKILNNSITYSLEFHIFSNFKLLLGSQFIENWKNNSDPNIDFIEKIRNIFKENFDENSLKEIIAIIFLLKNVDKLNLSDFQSMSDNLQTYIRNFKLELKNINSNNEILDIEIQRLTKRIIDETNKSINREFINSEIRKEKLVYIELISKYTILLDNIKHCNGDKNKLKALIRPLGIKYDENKDYEEAFEEIISKANFMLTSNSIEIEITEKMSTKLKDLKFEIEKLINNKDNNKKLVEDYTNSCNIYSFSIEILTSVIKRFSNYNSLSAYEKQIYNYNLKLEIQLLFNECLNKLLSSHENPELFLEDYYSLLKSSFITREPLDNIESSIYNKNKDLTKKLTNSRLRSQSIFSLKPGKDYELIPLISIINNDKLDINQSTIKQEIDSEHII